MEVEMSGHAKRGGHGIESLETRRLLAAAGALDTSFSGDGLATLSFPGESITANEVAVQADGKTVVVGTTLDATTGNTRFITARFNLDGTLDGTFGVGGVARNAPGDRGKNAAKAVTIAPDGKIVVVGDAETSEGLFNETELAVVRYNANGTLDNTFAGNGILTLDLGGPEDADTHGEDVAVLSNGTIVAVGKAYQVPDFDFFVTYLRTDGARLETFYPAFGEEDGAVAMKLDPTTNRVFVTGNIDSGDTPAAFQRRVGLERITPADSTGDFKTDFSLPGRSRTDVKDLILQPSGKIVIAGNSVSLDGANDFFVARFTAAGQLDPTFGGAAQGGGPGFTLTNLGGDDVAGGLTLSPSGGGFIVSGRSNSTTVAVKYTDDGALDTTFGTGGVVRISAFSGTAKIVRGAGRRVVLAGGAGFQTARLLTAGANVVSVTPFDSVATEGKVDPALFVVQRPEVLPTPTRVYFSIGGTAIGPGLALAGTRDYTADTLIKPTPTFGGGDTRAYVDIPAGEKFAFVTLTTIDDTRVEGTETAVFTILADPSYEIGTPSGLTVQIKDDDLLSFTVGTSTATKPPKQVDVGEELQSVVTWTVPSGGWRQLSSIQLRLRDLDDEDALVLLTFDEATNSFSVASTAAAGVAPVTLLLSKCSFQADGPTAPTVTLTFTWQFTAAAAKHKYALEVAADNDTGEFSGFSQIGTIHVHKKSK
jgi:uncharacterized delta-60 repeat protein